MNVNEKREIEAAQHDGERGDNLLPVSTTVVIRRCTIPGKVIGHYDGAMIIAPLSCSTILCPGGINISDIEIYGPVIGPLSHDGIEGLDDNNPLHGHF